MLFAGRINGFPADRRSKTRITSQEILDICVGGDVPEDNFCASFPSGITESGIQ